MINEFKEISGNWTSGRNKFMLCYYILMHSQMLKNGCRCHLIIFKTNSSFENEYPYLKMIFLGKFQVYRKIEKDRVPMYPLPPDTYSFPIINIFHQSGLFVTIDESTLTRHKYSKFVIYIMVILDVVHFEGLDKCVMTCIHQYSIIWIGFTAL